MKANDPQTGRRLRFRTTAAGSPSSPSRAGPRARSTCKDLQANTEPITVVAGKDFLYSGEVFDGTMYIVTNEDAPHYKVFAAPAETPDARPLEAMIIPQSEDAVLQGLHIIGGKLVAKYEKNASSLLKVFSVEGQPLAEVRCQASAAWPASAAQWDSQEAFFGFQSFTVPPTIYRFDLRHQNEYHVVGPRSRRRIDSDATRSSRSGIPRRTARACRCSWSCKKGPERDRQQSRRC